MSEPSVDSIAGTEEHRRLLTLATNLSVTVALVLIVAKAYAWSLTDSVAILASLVDSLMDAGASLLNLFAVRYALAPADATIVAAADVVTGAAAAATLAAVGRSHAVSPVAVWK